MLVVRFKVAEVDEVDDPANSRIRGKGHCKRMRIMVVTPPDTLSDADDDADNVVEKTSSGGAKSLAQFHSHGIVDVKKNFLLVMCGGHGPLLL